MTITTRLNDGKPVINKEGIIVANYIKAYSNLDSYKKIS